VDLARRRLWTNAFPMEALRTRIERYRVSISVKKRRLSQDDLDTRFDSKPRLLSMIFIAAAATDMLTTLSQARSTPRQMARS
jgi:hypothetical protein